MWSITFSQLQGVTVKSTINPDRRCSQSRHHIGLSEQGVVFVRRVGRRRYFIDPEFPDKEFYLFDAAIPLAFEEDAPLPPPVKKLVHEKYPHLGEYWVDKDGREIFEENGRPFYMGRFENKVHKIFIGKPVDPRVFRSRVGFPAASGRSSGGTYRLGGSLGSSS